MKRSEALDLIDKVYGEFVADWLKADINNLEEFMPLNERILSALEEAGMYPPQAEAVENSEHFKIYIDNIDIPHWFVLGWDNE